MSETKVYRFTDLQGKPGYVTGELANGNLTLNTAEVERLLQAHFDALPFDVMAEGYGDDDDFVGLCATDLDEDGSVDDDWGPFEVWAVDLLKLVDETHLCSRCDKVTTDPTRSVMDDEGRHWHWECASEYVFDDRATEDLDAWLDSLRPVMKPRMKDVVLALLGPGIDWEASFYRHQKPVEVLYLDLLRFALGEK